MSRHKKLNSTPPLRRRRRSRVALVLNGASAAYGPSRATGALCTFDEGAASCQYYRSQSWSKDARGRPGCRPVSVSAPITFDFANDCSAGSHHHCPPRPPCSTSPASLGPPGLRRTGRPYTVLLRLSIAQCASPPLPEGKAIGRPGPGLWCALCRRCAPRRPTRRPRPLLL